MAKRLEDRRLTLNVTEAALEWLGKTGEHPAGAVCLIPWS